MEAVRMEVLPKERLLKQIQGKTVRVKMIRIQKTQRNRI